MPSCCIKQCRAKKSQNQPTLTFHRFPRNEGLKEKWLEIIGTENINPRIKAKYVCSMHFDDTSFNRTLDVIRLRDGTVPSSSLVPSQTHTQSTLDMSLHSQLTSNVTVSYETIIDDRGGPSTSTVPERVDPILLKKLTYLTKKCKVLKKKVKSLNEKVRRRDKILAIFSNIITNLQKRNLLKNEESLILEECTGPEEKKTNSLIQSL